MEDYKVYECPKCQIRKQYNLNDKVDFICKCCGGKMKYMTTVRKNSTKPYKKENYYSNTINFNTSSNIPKCPTCNSTNIEKISTGKKMFGGVLFGIFSADVRNTMHCKNCGYKW